MQARRVPFPSSISEAARDRLGRQVDEDGVPLNARYTMPSPNDHAGWMQLKATADGHYVAAVKGLAGTLRATVETVRTGTATIHVATPEAVGAPDRAYVDFHDGAFVLGGGEACRMQAQMQADQLAVELSRFVQARWG
ncbi:hypothetical protein ABIC65_002405 [Sphingomonas trueperi]|uniref:hypothetical protein n=1 Tax=Sphingomonas trueperi TaxID=53317 RepID=UPI003396E872